MSEHATRYYIRARSEDGPQFWDGSHSWDSSRKGAKEYDSFAEAEAVAASLNNHVPDHSKSNCWCERRGPARVNSIATPAWERK